MGGPMEFDAVEGLKVMEELVRVTAPPTTLKEICDHGVALTAKALRASGGAIFLRRMEDRAGGPPSEGGASDETLHLEGAWGASAPVESLGSAARVLENGAGISVEPASGEGPVARLAIPIPGGSRSMGVLLVAQPRAWSPHARAFVLGAAQAIGSSLQAAHRLVMSHYEGTLLVERNVELEALHELAEALQSRHTEQETLQVALDLVLRKLVLQSGWVFWGDSRLGLQLAAHRGIDEDFVCRWRESGIGSCLCRDVFATGRLMYARNTTDCPRLPELVSGTEPMTHACIPLKFERGIMGVMNIANRPGRLFTPTELQFLEIVGKQVCLAVDKVRTARSEHRAERLAVIGTLAASLAHEVRNPLNSIHLQLVLLSRRASRLDGAAGEELGALVDTAQQEISRLDGLVEEFLSLSSIDRLTPTETDLEDVVRDVLLLMGPAARERSISVVDALAGSLPRLWIDSEKIKQVLINLVRNSIDAMPGGGTLTVVTRTEEDTVRLDVADTGSGIAPGLDIFDLFMTTKRGGTGLGLPIARRIVEAHGGSLTYESMPGQRTVFTVALRANHDR